MSGKQLFNMDQKILLIVPLVVLVLLVSGCVQEASVKMAPEKEVFTENETIVINFENLNGLSVSNSRFSLYRGTKNNKLRLIGCVKCYECFEGKLEEIDLEREGPLDKIFGQKKIEIKGYYSKAKSYCNGTNYTAFILTLLDADNYIAEFCHTKNGKKTCIDAKFEIIKTISEANCLNQGSKIVGMEIGCESGETNLGRVSDVKCKCWCCKPEKNYTCYEQYYTIKSEQKRGSDYCVYGNPKQSETGKCILKEEGGKNCTSDSDCVVSGGSCCYGCYNINSLPVYEQLGLCDDMPPMRCECIGGVCGG